MKKIQSINGLREIEENYDIFILDQWGVMHDGKYAFPSAIECVSFLHEQNKILIIISNSSRRKNITEKNLLKLGFNKNHFNEIMTSGEIVWQSLYKPKHKLIKNLKKNCYHIYGNNNEGKIFISGLERYNFVDKIDDADFILGCTPLKKFTTLDYIPILEKALKKKIPFVCANPDFVTVQSKTKQLVFCMGSIAELFKTMGGEVFYLGKPNYEIYSESLKKIKNFNKKRILAIGDSLYHDIGGAKSFGIDSLLITSGIHYDCFDKKSPRWDTNINKLKKIEIKPDFLCSSFKK